MDKIEEILPRISEYLIKDLSKEKLSPIAEATRLFYVERIKSLIENNDENKNNSNTSQLHELVSFLGKKFKTDKSEQNYEKQNGFLKNDDHIIILNGGLETADSQHSNESVQPNCQNSDLISENYDSEFDSSDDDGHKSSSLLPSSQKQLSDDYATATFKADFYQNILLKMRKRTCFIVGTELICCSHSGSKVESRFSLLNCKTNLKQHESKFPIEVRLKPTHFNLASFFTTDTQLAWRFVKAIKDAGGLTTTSNKADKRQTIYKEYDQQSNTTQSSETINNEYDRTDVSSDPKLISMVQNFFGTMGKKKGRGMRKLLQEMEPNAEALISGYVKLHNKSLTSRWHKMYCYVIEGHFYAKKEPMDDHVEMAVPLKGASVGMPYKDVSKELKVEIIQKEIKVCIELSDVMEHGRWIKVLLKETTVLPGGPSDVIYFDHIGESSLNSTEKCLNEEEKNCNDSTYINFSELLALSQAPPKLNGTTDVTKLSKDVYKSEIKENKENERNESYIVDSDSIYEQDNADKNISDTQKKAPPVSAKPYFPKRLIKTTETPISNQTILSNAENDNAIYSSVIKNKTSSNQDKKKDLVSNLLAKQIMLNNETGAFNNDVNYSETNNERQPFTKHGTAERLTVNQHGIPQSHNPTKPKPIPQKPKPLSKSTLNLNDLSKFHEKEPRLNRKTDVKLISVDDAQLRNTKLKPASDNRRSMVFEKIMHFESEDEC